MEEESEAKKSRYNAAFSQFYRLDGLWKMCNNYSIFGNLKKWNWVLDAIWRELSGDAQKGDHVKFYKINNKIGLSRNKYSLLYFNTGLKEEFLRKLQNKQGKGTAYLDEDEDMM